MSRESAADAEARRYEKRQANLQSNFQGTAKVLLRHLSFPSQQENRAGDLHLNHRNIARLVQIFNIEGCHRLDPANHIPVLIDEDSLQQSLVQSGLTKVDLLKKHTPPLLRLEETAVLDCLHGRHRIAAAHEFLLPVDKWWAVDLYFDGMLIEHGLWSDY